MESILLKGFFVLLTLFFSTFSRTINKLYIRYFIRFENIRIYVCVYIYIYIYYEREVQQFYTSLIRGNHNNVPNHKSGGSGVGDIDTGTL